MGARCYRIDNAMYDMELQEQRRGRVRQKLMSSMNKTKDEFDIEKRIMSNVVGIR